MENKKNRISELKLKDVLEIKSNDAKHLFQKGYYKIIEIKAFDPKDYGPDLPERYEATAYFKGPSDKDYSSNIVTLHRINPLLNKDAKHNLFEFGMGRPKKSLKNFLTIAAKGEIQIIEILRPREVYIIEWKLIPFD